MLITTYIEFLKDQAYLFRQGGHIDLADKTEKEIMCCKEALTKQMISLLAKQYPNGPWIELELK